MSILTPEEIGDICNKYGLWEGETFDGYALKAPGAIAAAQHKKDMEDLQDPDLREKALALLVRALQEAEMRRGCTNHTDCADRVLNWIATHLHH